MTLSRNPPSLWVLAWLAVLVLAGCMTRPRSYATPVPATMAPATVFDCVQREIKHWDYTIMGASTGSAYIRAERMIRVQPHPEGIARGTLVWTGAPRGRLPDYDEVTTVVLRDKAGNQALQVTASQIRLQGRHRIVRGTRLAELEAEFISRACGRLARPEVVSPILNIVPRVGGALPR